MLEGTYQVHWELEQRHWWFRGRRAIILAVLRRFCPELQIPGHELLEIGCGTGGNLSYFRSFFLCRGIDYHEGAARMAAERSGVPVQCRDAYTLEPGEYKNCSAVLILDLLEHLEDPVGLLRVVSAAVSPSAKLIITVPAHPWLRSHHDDSFGHLRRYTCKMLTQAVLDADLDLLYYTFFNCLPFLPAACFRLVDRLRPKFMPRRHLTDFTLTPPWMDGILLRIFALETKWVPSISLPIGLSLLAVARNRRVPDVRSRKCACCLVTGDV